MAKAGSGKERDSVIERLERELRDMRARSDAAEARLADQSARLTALGSGREESMRLLSETRAELSRVIAERDELKKRLDGIDRMQTETVAFTEEEQKEAAEATGNREVQPTIEELMSNLNDMIAQDPRRGARLGGQSTEAPEAQWQEMLAPEVIVPEEFGEKHEAKWPHERRRENRRREGDVPSHVTEPPSEVADRPSEVGEPPSQVVAAPRHAKATTTNLLVFLDAAHPIKYPLYKDLMTIGRSEDADIQIDGHFISRVHARIVRTGGKVTVEDVGSKNGISVNSESVKRRELKHGDVIGIGKLRFTFVEVSV
jgi:hypothetical protein